MEYISNLRDSLTESGDIGPPMGEGRQLATFLAGIVAWVTSTHGYLSDAEIDKLLDEPGEPPPLNQTNLFCANGPDPTCPGEIFARLTDDQAIVWDCIVCGTCGVIRDWEWTRWDLSDMR
jgi:hypothetical protein